MYTQILIKTKSNMIKNKSKMQNLVSNFVCFIFYLTKIILFLNSVKMLKICVIHFVSLVYLVLFWICSLWFYICAYTNSVVCFINILILHSLPSCHMTWSCDTHVTPIHHKIIYLECCKISLISFLSSFCLFYALSIFYFFFIFLTDFWPIRSQERCCMPMKGS